MNKNFQSVKILLPIPVTAVFLHSMLSVLFGLVFVDRVLRCSVRRVFVNCEPSHKAVNTGSVTGRIINSSGLL
jgi:hypothetical protein